MKSEIENLHADILQHMLTFIPENDTGYASLLRTSKAMLEKVKLNEREVMLKNIREIEGLQHKLLQCSKKTAEDQEILSASLSLMLNLTVHTNTKPANQLSWFQKLSSYFTANACIENILQVSLLYSAVLFLYEGFGDVVTKDEFYIKDEILKNEAARDGFFLYCNANHSNQEQLNACKLLIENAWSLTPYILAKGMGLVVGVEAVVGAAVRLYFLGSFFKKLFSDNLPILANLSPDLIAKIVAFTNLEKNSPETAQGTFIDAVEGEKSQDQYMKDLSNFIWTNTADNWQLNQLLEGSYKSAVRNSVKFTLWKQKAETFLEKSVSKDDQAVAWLKQVFPVP